MEIKQYGLKKKEPETTKVKFSKPLNVEGDFQSSPPPLKEDKFKDENLKMATGLKMAKETESLKDSIRAVEAEDNFAETPEIEEKRPFEMDNLMLMGIMQAAGTGLGALLGGGDLAYGASKGGTEAINEEAKRQHELNKAKKETLQKNQFGKGLVEMQRDGEKRLFTQEEAYHASREVAPWTKVKPLIELEKGGLQTQENISDLIGKRKPRPIIVEMPSGEKALARSSGDASALQRQGQGVWRDPKGNIVERTTDRTIVVNKAIDDLSRNAIYTELSKGEMDALAASKLIASLGGSEVSRDNAITFSTLINRMVKASGDPKISDNDRKDFKSPKSIPDRISALIDEWGSGKFTIPKEDMKKTIEIMLRHATAEKTKFLKQYADSYSQRGRTYFRPEVLQHILKNERIYNEGMAAYEQELADITAKFAAPPIPEKETRPKGKPKTVIQNGHTYILNEKTGKYE